MRDSIKRIFERHSDSMEQLQESLLAEFDTFQNPFSMMATTYMQDSTIKMLFNPVKPEEVVMSQKVCRVKKGQSKVLAVRNRNFYYVPLIRTVFANSRIFDMLNTTPHHSLATKMAFCVTLLMGAFLKSTLCFQ